MTPDGGLGSTQGGTSLSDNGALASLDDRVDERGRCLPTRDLPSGCAAVTPASWHLLAPGTPTREAMVAAYELLRKQGHDTGTALRILRQLVMERLITLDCDEQAPLGLVTTRGHRTGRVRAGHRLRAGPARPRRSVTARPRHPMAQRAQLWIVGMGKLGARELNVSSDIDLIYIYDQDGETAGVEGGRGPHLQP